MARNHPPMVLLREPTLGKDALAAALRELGWTDAVVDSAGDDLGLPKPASIVSTGMEVAPPEPPALLMSALVRGWTPGLGEDLHLARTASRLAGCGAVLLVLRKQVDGWFLFDAGEPGAGRLAADEEQLDVSPDGTFGVKRVRPSSSFLGVAAGGITKLFGRCKSRHITEALALWASPAWTPPPEDREADAAPRPAADPWVHLANPAVDTPEGYLALVRTAWSRRDAHDVRRVALDWIALRETPQRYMDAVVGCHLGFPGARLRWGPADPDEFLRPMIRERAGQRAWAPLFPALEFTWVDYAQRLESAQNVGFVALFALCLLLDEGRTVAPPRKREGGGFGMRVHRATPVAIQRSVNPLLHRHPDLKDEVRTVLRRAGELVSR